MAKSTPKVTIVECPTCASDIRIIKSPKVGQIVTCAECYDEMRVSQLNPVEIEYLDDFEYEDDYDFDDDSDVWD